MSDRSDMVPAGAIGEIAPAALPHFPRPGGALRRIADRIPPPLLAGLIHCLIVFAIAALTVWRSPDRDALRPPGFGLTRYLVGPLSIWDGAWYERIAREGYAEQQAAAFWPLYPLLTRFVSNAAGLSVALAGIILSNLAFIAALFVLDRLVTQRYGTAISTRTVWLVALSPFSFFFSALYTESLFFLFSLSAILLARGERWTAAALVLLFAMLTRNTGALIALPILFALVEQRGWAVRRLARPALQIGAALAAPLALAVHIDRIWGDPLLMMRAQVEWNRTFSWPWMTLWSGVRRTELIYINARYTCFDAVRAGEWPPCRDALQLNVDSLSDDLATVGAIVAIALLILSVRMLDPGDAVYAFAVFTVPLFTTTVADPLYALPRYLLIAYPLFIVLAMLLHRRWLYLTVLGVSAAGLGWLLSVFARAYFVA